MRSNTLGNMRMNAVASAPRNTLVLTPHPAEAGRLVCIGLKARFDAGRIDRLIESLTHESIP